MLKLPTSTILNKSLTKKAIFAKFDVKPAARDKFDADISKISIVHEISPVTTGIVKGENVEAFFVLLVTLKHKHFDEKSIVLLSRLISQKMLFVLSYNDKAKLAVYHTKFMQSDWSPMDELSIELSGSNLDTVWENMIAQAGNIVVEPGKTLDEQIRLNEERKKLQQRIDSLERLARAEKQPRKKFELVQEIKKLENEMIAILSPTKKEY
jgi:hypothetical protein